MTSLFGRAECRSWQVAQSRGARCRIIALLAGSKMGSAARSFPKRSSGARLGCSRNRSLTAVRIPVTTVDSIGSLHTDLSKLEFGRMCIHPESSILTNAGPDQFILHVDLHDAGKPVDGKRNISAERYH